MLSTTFVNKVLVSFFVLFLLAYGPAFGSDPVPIPAKTIGMDVALVRFKPNKPERVLQGFRDLSGNVAGVVETLKKDGVVSVLYFGTREMRLEDKTKAKFDATETRPVVLVGKPGAPVPP